MPKDSAYLTQADWDALVPHVLVTDFVESLLSKKIARRVALPVASCMLEHRGKAYQHQEMGLKHTQAYEKGLLEEVTCEHFFFCQGPQCYQEFFGEANLKWPNLCG